MNKFLFIALFAVTSLSAWEDHPDRDEDRRNEASNSNNYVESKYDWSNRDPDSRDNNNSSHENPGTINGPNDSKD